MIKDKTQKQESGDNSANYQAETINQYGISYRDAKEIALDVFQQNFIKLSEQAKQMAKERAEELTNKFLDGIKEKNPNLLNSVQEPSMQNVLYSAQKSYAISGDKDIADLLVDILIVRAEQNKRNLDQLILDESLEIASKLTIQQLDFLTVILLVKYVGFKNLNTLDSLVEYFNNTIQPFAKNLTSIPSYDYYTYLEICGCIRRTDSFLPNSPGFSLPSIEVVQKVENISFWGKKTYTTRSVYLTTYEVWSKLKNRAEFVRHLKDITYPDLTAIGKLLGKANYKRRRNT